MPASSSRVISVSSLIGVFALTLAAQSNGSAPASTWDPPRLSDGQPNVQGMWIAVNDSVFTLTPAVEDDNLERNRTRAPRPDPSRVAEPNHVIPYQPWAKAKQLLLQAYKDNPAQDFYIDPQVRCSEPNPWGLLAGLPASPIPRLRGLRIRRVSRVRIIPVDAVRTRTRVSVLHGRLGGHWEGKTLVVEIINNNSKGKSSREGDSRRESPGDRKIHIPRREKVEVRSVLTDPIVYTRPWKIVAEFMPKRGGTGYQQWEEACHEAERERSRSENIK